MKNLFFILILLFIASCGEETKTAKQTSTTSKSVKSEIKKPETATTNPDAVVAKLEDNSKSISEASAKEMEKATERKKEVTTTKGNSSDNSTKPVEKKVKKIPVKENTPIPRVETIDAEKTNAEAAKQKALAEQKALEAQKKLAEQKNREEEVKQQKADAEAAAKLKLENEKMKTEAAAKTEFSHTAFDALLKKYVNASGKVNYKGLKKDEAKLNAYLASLEATPIGNDWGRKKKMAYWINAYNAYTLKLIVKNYPISSITKLHGGKPWDVKWIKLNGETLSLNNIENDILRPRYKDARIHFAVNCAAKSCPPLLNKAWTASNLESNFNRQAKSFINNSKYNSISKNSAKVSKIFDWYGKDFGNLTEYLNKYSNAKIASGTTISFMEYDWALNE